MPDVDLDFCIKRRVEVIDFLVQRYGEPHVSQIITFGTMQSRAVVRDVGRALGTELKDVDYLAKLIPAAPGKVTTIPEALELVQVKSKTMILMKSISAYLILRCVWKGLLVIHLLTQRVF